MKRIIALVSAIVFSISIYAQDVTNFERLCLSANENMKANRFEDALKDYDAAMAIIQNEKRPDLAANIDTELIDFVIIGIAKQDPEKAKQYALVALGTRMECLAYYANEGVFESKEDYVDNIANEAINMGYTLAGIGFLDDAESCLLSAVQVYPQTKVFTPNYILAQEIMCDFFTKYRENPGKGLEWEYEAFQSSASLYEYDSEVTIETFDHIALYYGIGIAFYSFADSPGLAERFPDIPIYSYDQIIGLVDSWSKIRDEIIRKNGETFYTSYVSHNPVNLIGEDRIVFGSKEHDALFKALAAVHHHRIADYEAATTEMLALISEPYDKVVYVKTLTKALENNGYINLASSLYQKLQSVLENDGRKDLATSVSADDAAFMFNYGQYDYAWSKVESVVEYASDDNYIPEYPQAYIRQLIVLSSLYDRFKNDLQNSLSVMERAISLATSSTADKDNRLLSTLYNNLSTIYERGKLYSQACDAIITAIDYARKLAIEHDALDDFENGAIWPANQYLNLAGCYIDMGEDIKAEQILLQCVDYYQKYYPESEEQLKCFDELVYLNNKRGDVDKMLRYSELSLKCRMSAYLYNIQGMSKVQRSDYWEKTNGGYFDINSQFALQNKVFSGLAYDSALIEKGLLVRLDGLIRDNVRKSGDIELIASYDKYKEAERLGLESKKSLEDRLMYLYSKHPEFHQKLSFHTWREVQSRLTKQDIAIEFATCCSDGFTVSYAAHVLRNGWDGPQTIYLGTQEQFNDIMKMGSKAYRDNDAIYNLIWKKLEPLLGGVKNIYFSPYGAISQINIEVLEDKKGKPVNKVYNVFRLSSTGDLCEQTKQFKTTSATLYGGLNYDTSTSVLVASSRAYSQSPSTGDSFSVFDADKTRKGWNYLPGTKKEIEEISRILDSKKIERIIFTQSQGTEEAFKSMSGRSTPLLHIATHGFYLSEKDAARSKPSLMSRDGSDTHSYPLRRCGLILSGGQHAWLGEELPDGIEDGILTGEEIAGMNLSDTDLVVLSACQTGLGDIARDGVYGLQRAFKIAGVGTIIMSLWEVNDSATELMMTKFYGALSSGKTKRDAFDSAIAAVKKEFEGPEYWAAFIMLD